MIYLWMMNVFGLIICGLDKRKAIKKQYRISEKFLFLISALGGCFGFWIGMYLFHHKTKKWKFKIGIPILCFLWIFLIVKGELWQKI